MYRVIKGVGFRALGALGLGFRVSSLRQWGVELRCRFGRVILSEHVHVGKCAMQIDPEGQRSPKQGDPLGSLEVRTPPCRV